MEQKAIHVSNDCLTDHVWSVPQLKKKKKKEIYLKNYYALIIIYNYSEATFI